jgi:hypothetical protein
MRMRTGILSGPPLLPRVELRHRTSERRPSISTRRQAKSRYYTLRPRRRTVGYGVAR